MFRKKIVNRTFEYPGERIEMGNIIMGRGLFGFHLGDEAVREFQFEGQIGLRKAALETQFFHGVNDVPVQSRNLFDGLFGRFALLFGRLLYT